MTAKGLNAKLPNRTVKIYKTGKLCVYNRKRKKIIVQQSVSEQQTLIWSR